MGYGAILTETGRPRDAIPLFREAIRLNPKPPNIYIRFLSKALRECRQYEEAIALARKAIAQEPDDLVAYELLTSSLMLAGREEEARKAAKQMLRIDPKYSVSRMEKMGHPKIRATVKRFCDALRKAGLPE